MKQELLSSHIIVASIAAISIGLVMGWWFKSKKDKSESKEKAVLLQNPDAKYTVPLIGKSEISHNTRMFRFGLPRDRPYLGLPTGQHIYLSATINGENVFRPYTPITGDDEMGYFDLIIKIYFKNQHPKFPDGGKLTQYLDTLAIGHTVQVRGPNGRCVYNGDSNFAIKKDIKSPPTIFNYKKVGMIAGGTGITPLLAIMTKVVKSPDDTTQIWLIFANQSEDDILCRKELDELASKHPDRVKIWYTIDKGSDTWKYSVGYIDEQMIRDHLPPPSDDTIVLMCGPPPMITYACIPNLEKVGHTEDRRFKF